MKLDLDFVRQQFPAFAEASLARHAFFDNAGGSQILQRAIDRVVEFFTTSMVQLGGSYAVSQLATERVTDGRRALARWIHCDDSEVVIGGELGQRLRDHELEPGAPAGFLELDSAPLRDQLINQRITTKSAEANFQNAKLTREVAEIAVVEYEQGIYIQDLATVEGEIKLAESDLAGSLVFGDASPGVRGVVRFPLSWEGA